MEKQSLTQRRKDAKKKTREKLCISAPLRETKTVDI